MSAKLAVAVGPTRQILVVEDEFLIAMELEQTLRRAGYQVVGPAPSLGTALELLRQVRPDAAVLDVNVGGERVTPVAEVLRAMAVPFVLASGYGAADPRWKERQFTASTTTKSEPFNG